jgi:hypothetical protein
MGRSFQYFGFNYYELARGRVFAVRSETYGQANCG